MCGVQICDSLGNMKLFVTRKKFDRLKDEARNEVYDEVYEDAFQDGYECGREHASITPHYQPTLTDEDLDRLREEPK